MADTPSPVGRRRLLWFVLLYGGSLLAFTSFVYGFKAFIPR